MPRKEEKTRGEKEGETGKMTVEEAGRKGGQKERKLVEEGRRAEEKGERSRK